MIEISLGNIGSGKTASIVRSIVLNRDGKHTFSNITMKGVKNNTTITADMIIKTTYDDKGKEKLELNVDFWKGVVKKYKSINVVLDEAHNLIDSRRSQSKQNQIMNSYLSMLRRIVGSSTQKGGTLTLISQISRRLDVIAREMCTRVMFHKAHYIVECKKCGFSVGETNEEPEKMSYCPLCDSTNLKQHTYIIEVWSFKNMEKYELFEQYGTKSYFNHYIITDISDYFKNYNTYQWENLF